MLKFWEKMEMGQVIVRVKWKGYGKWQTTQIANDARYEHIYNGRRIGTRMRSIK